MLAEKINEALKNRYVGTPEARKLSRLVDFFMPSQNIQICECLKTTLEHVIGAGQLTASNAEYSKKILDVPALLR